MTGSKRGTKRHTDCITNALMILMTYEGVWTFGHFMLLFETFGQIWFPNSTPSRPKASCFRPFNGSYWCHLMVLVTIAPLRKRRNRPPRLGRPASHPQERPVNSLPSVWCRALRLFDTAAMTTSENSGLFMSVATSITSISRSSRLFRDAVKARSASGS
jgi:hypothetical protein